MRYAIVSDLHANFPAWNAVMADLYAQGTDLVVCLGDVVGYGPHPAEVLNSLRSVCENCIMGNHDAAAAGIMDYSLFNAQARNAIEWTMATLGESEKSHLASLPLAIDAGDILFVHAEIAQPGRFGYVNDVRIARENFDAGRHFVTFLGHTHFPNAFVRDASGGIAELPDNDLVLESDKRYIVNVGSVGEPRNPNDLRARYVIYDDQSHSVTFRRVEFDIAAYRQSLEASTLTHRPFFLRVYQASVEESLEWAAASRDLVDMQVAGNRDSLVDLGQVAGVAGLRNADPKPGSSRSKRSRNAVLVASVALALALLAFWIFSERQSHPQLSLAATEPEDLPAETKPNPLPPDEVDPASLSTKETIETPAPPAPKPSEPRPMVEVQPEPPAPPEIEPQPVEPIMPDPATPAAPAKASLAESIPPDHWWRMGEENVGSSLVDEGGEIQLAAIREGKVIKALAPNPVPGNQANNTSALQLGVWQESKAHDHFGLSASGSFTFEGWVFVGSFRKPVFLFGTRTGETDKRGWHLDLRPESRNEEGESMSFFYDTGSEQIQALATGVSISDGEAHHFAVVWDHDAFIANGVMTLYLDGKNIASARLPHSRLIDRQAHPFRIGANFNPEKLGLDELRFTRRSLLPHEFLLRAPITGPTLIKADGRVTDSWSDPSNWDGGRIPEGAESAIIASDLKVQIHHEDPKTFTGSLVLKQGSSLHLWSPLAETVLPQYEARLILFADSQLVLRSKESSRLGRIELRDDAHVFGGISTGDHHTTRHFASEVSGPGQLILNGVQGNVFSFDAPSTFQGGLRTESSDSQTFEIHATVDQCFGQGHVEIADHASLRVGENIRDAIPNHADLILKGPKGTLASKLVLESHEQVARFVVDGQDQGEGIFDQVSHPHLISGEGKLTVQASQD